MVRQADKRDPSDDIDAVFSRGEGRTVSCFLRATFDPFPDAFAPGALRIDARTVSWSRGIVGKGGEGAAGIRLTHREHGTRATASPSRLK